MDNRRKRLLNERTRNQTRRNRKGMLNSAELVKDAIVVETPKIPGPMEFGSIAPLSISFMLPHESVLSTDDRFHLA